MARSGLRAEGIEERREEQRHGERERQREQDLGREQHLPGEDGAHPEREPAAGEVALDEPDDEMRRDGQQEHGGGVDVRQPGREHVGGEAEDVAAGERGPDRAVRQPPAEQERRPGGERRHQDRRDVVGEDRAEGEGERSEHEREAGHARGPGEVVAAGRPDLRACRRGSARAGSRAATTRTTRRRSAGRCRARRPRAARGARRRGARETGRRAPGRRETPRHHAGPPASDASENPPLESRPGRTRPPETRLGTVPRHGRSQTRPGTVPQTRPACRRARLGTVPVAATPRGVSVCGSPGSAIATLRAASPRRETNGQATTALRAPIAATASTRLRTATAVSDMRSPLISACTPGNRGALGSRWERP